jgi:hypothetical protein
MERKSSRRSCSSIWSTRPAKSRRAIQRSSGVGGNAIKILKLLGDRGHVCESQHRLAQVLVAQGRIEEAERYPGGVVRPSGPRTPSR